MNTKLLLFLAALTVSTATLAQIQIKAQVDIGGSNDDNFSSLCTSGNNLLLAGTSSSDQSKYKSANSRGNNDYWVVKLKANLATGTVSKEWDKTIGGSGNDDLTKAIATKDGGFLLAGNSNSGISGEKTEANINKNDYWLVKLDAQGNIQWDKTIGDITDENLQDIAQTDDGGYIMIGAFNSYLQTRMIKLDGSGNIQWQKDSLRKYGYGDPGSIEQTSDGGYIMSGSGATKEVGITKTDAAGNFIWQQGFDFNAFTLAFKGKRTEDDGYVLYGLFLTDVDDDYYFNLYQDVIKTDKNGTVEWRYEDHISENPGDLDMALDQTSDKGFIASYRNPDSAGYTIKKLDKNGSQQWVDIIHGGYYDVPKDIKEIFADKYIVAGDTQSGILGDKTKPNLGGYDYWAVAFQKSAEAASGNFASATEAGLNKTNWSFQPNPANSIIHIKATKANFVLFDASGKIAAKASISGNGSIDTSNLKPGLYFLKNENDGSIRTVMVSK